MIKITDDRRGGDMMIFFDHPFVFPNQFLSNTIISRLYTPHVLLLVYEYAIFKP